MGECTSCYPGYKVESGRCIISLVSDSNCKKMVAQQCT